MKRRTLVLVALFGLLMAAMAILPAQATPEPMKVNGNTNCDTIPMLGGSTGDSSLKIEPVLNGTYSGPGGVEITIILDEKQPNAFGFVINGGLVHDVIVKGSAANWYHYFTQGDGGSPVSSDTGLTIPNGNALNRAWFCYDVTAEIAGTKFEDTNANGTDDPGEPGVGGWEIFLINDGGFVDSTSTSEVAGQVGRYSLPGPETGSYVVCEAANGPDEGTWVQSGPLGPENDVCPDSVLVLEGEIEFTVDLAPGGYAVDYESGTSVVGLDFFNFDEGGQPIACGDSVPLPGNEFGVSGSFTRLADDPETGCGDSEPPKGVLLEVTEDQTVTFIPFGFGTVNYRSRLIFEKPLGNFPILTYDQDEDGPMAFEPVQICIDPHFDGEGQVVDATIPPGQTWCIVGLDVEDAVVVGDGEPNTVTMIVTWDLFGRGDPRFH